MNRPELLHPFAAPFAVLVAILVAVAGLLVFIAFTDYNARVFGTACVESGGHFIHGQCVQPGELCEGGSR